MKLNELNIVTEWYAAGILAQACVKHIVSMLQQADPNINRTGILEYIENYIQQNRDRLQRDRQQNWRKQYPNNESLEYAMDDLICMMTDNDGRMYPTDRIMEMVKSLDESLDE